MKRLDLTLATAVDITAATAGPALAAPTFNENNRVGVVLSGATPENFAHGEEAERAVSIDGRTGRPAR
jgi:hypothetical protein